jgi:folate-binding protein YgfZ
MANLGWMGVVSTLPPFWSVVARDALEVRGPDALAYLQGQVSQDLLPMAVGDSRWTFLLEPAGKVEVLARVWRTGDDAFVFDTDAGFGDALAARLARFKIRVKADLERLTWSAVAVRGVGGERPDGAVVGWWDRDYDVLGPGPTPPLDVEERARADYELARIERGWPAMGQEIVPGATIPGETGITSVAVDFRKGCYPGQELVERMDSRGASAPRRLRVLDVAAGSRPGDPILVAGAEVGRLTSVQGTLALGYVKRAVDLGRDGS